jgi:signal transduction histidine kinase
MHTEGSMTTESGRETGDRAPEAGVPLLERACARVGLPPYVAGIVSATPSLRLPWLAAAAVAALFAAIGASADPDRALLFLVVAPVMPLAGVAAAYGPWSDPMFETVRSTPVSGFTVVLARSVAVVVTAIAVLALASLVAPGSVAWSWAWVVPALALSLSSLVLSTLTSPPIASVIVAGAWCLALAAAAVLDDPFALFRGPAQLVFLTVAIAASLVIARRRERFEVEGLRARRSLVDAADTERRRIERDLHDGAQQQLVAIGVKAGLARMFVTNDPEQAVAMIDELRADAQDALESLREMTRGANPPILADEGLVAALAQRAKRAPVPVTIEADDIGRLATPTEVAAYFCCLEAMQNAGKYASAERVVVTVRRRPDELALSISDDGVGFDPATARRGVGLRSMTERTESLGGSLEVRSSPGRGTVVTARLPLAR